MNKFKESKLYLWSTITGFISLALPSAVGLWFPFMWGVLALTLFSAAIWITLEWRYVKNIFTNKHVHHGSFQLINILWAILLVIGLNFISAKYNRSFDMTSDRTNTLSKESLMVIKRSKENIVIKVFYTESANAQLKQSLKKLFKLYEKESTKVKSEFLNAKWEPSASEYLTNEDNVPLAVFVERGKIKERVSDPISEESVTSAIIRLGDNQKNVVYFTAGHGERGIKDSEPTGASELNLALNSRGLVTAPISLAELKNGEVPKDLYALIIAGPAKPFSVLELDILGAFLEDGGRLLLAVDPELANGFNQLTNSLGLNFESHYVLSVDSPLPLISVGNGFSLTSEITSDFKNAQVMFPVSSSIEIISKQTPEGVNLDPLVSTSTSSITANDSQQVQIMLQKISSKASLKLNSYNLAVIAMGQKKEASDNLHKGHQHAGQFTNKKPFIFIGFADSDFFSNEYINNAYNKDLILNSIVYLTGQKDLITIRPNQAKATTIEISSMGLNVGALISFFPFLIFSGLALFFWIKKRSQ